MAILVLLQFASSTAPVRAALPEPPSQHLPWQEPSIADTGIPASFLQAAHRLFAAGLADPRGGEYRTVRFAVNHPTTAFELPPSRGWVFKTPEGSAYRNLVVDWGGQVHLNAELLEDPADLDSDIQVLISMLESEVNRYRSRNTAFQSLVQRSPLLLGDLAQSEHPMKSQVLDPGQVILMLLRFNRTDLASQVWATNKNLPSAHSRSSMESLTLRWLVAIYWRLAEQFQSGRNEEALAIAESLTSWHSRVRDWLPAEDMQFLTPLPLLLADAKRRVSLVGRPNTLSVDDNRSLIRQLEDVRAGKAMFPGPLFYAIEPTYVKLRRAGDRIVDDLIDAWEHDTRLTRTFEYSRLWSRERTPIPVREVAKILLSEIVGDPVRVNNSTPAELRSWWFQSSRTGSSSALVERNFAMLADDQASPEQWRRAASYLTTRSDLEPQLYGNSASASACEPGKPEPPLRGESLRGRANPSLIELLSRRANELLARGGPGEAAEHACVVAFRAALWDPVAARPLLREVSANSTSCRGDYRVAIARLTFGDSDAASEWLTARSSRASMPFGTHPDAWVLPFWIFPNNSVLQQSLAEDWQRPLSSPGEFQVSSPLLVSPAYRRAVLTALEDATEVGTYSVEADGAVHYKLNFGSGGGTSTEGEAEPAGPFPIRAKDYTALQLSMTEGFPDFCLNWPIALKDSAISNIARFIADHASDFRAFPSRLAELDCPHSSRLIFNATR